MKDTTLGKKGGGGRDGVTFASRILISAVAQLRPLDVQRPIHENHMIQDQCAMNSYKNMQTQWSTLPSGKQCSALVTANQVGLWCISAFHSCIVKFKSKEKVVIVISSIYFQATSLPPLLLSFLISFTSRKTLEPALRMR